LPDALGRLWPRLASYPLFLQMLKDDSPPDLFPDHGELEEALAKLQEVINDINKQLHLAEAQREVFQLYRKLVNGDPRLIQSPRSVHQAGKLEHVVNGRSVSRQVFLLDDVMLVCESSDNGRKLELRWVWDLKSRDATVSDYFTPVFDVAMRTFLIKIADKREPVVFTALNVHEKEEWKQKISARLIAVRTRKTSVRTHRFSAALIQH